MKEIIIYTIESGLLLVYVYYLVWQYSAKNVPFYVKALTYFTWLLTFSIVMILPIDIANSSLEYQQEAGDSLYIVWRVMYWLNFILSWLVLPFFQDFEDSGDFTVRGKIRYSLRKNLTIYGLGLIMGISLVLYLAFKKHLTFSHIEGVLAGLGNLLYDIVLCSGLLLVIILLGYGLVAIPKIYIRESNEAAILQQCYSEAVILEEQRTEKLYELEEVCRVLFILQQEFANTEYTVYITAIMLQIPDDFKENLKQSIGSYNANNLLDQYKPISEKSLGTLNRQVKRLMFDMLRLETKFQAISDKAYKLEKKTIVDETQFDTKLWLMWFKINLIWNYKIRKYVNKYVGFLFALISSIILLAELCVLLQINFNLNLLNIMLNQITGFYWTQMYLIIPLLYMSFCTYYGLFKMKISGLISFNKGHHTDAPSLLFGSINFGRVSFPLCYNFLQLIQINAETSYTQIIGNMNVIPIFGQSFQTLLPLMLIVMCVVNLFNIGTKIMKAIGLGDYTTEDREDGLSSEGKSILDKERDGRSRMKIEVAKQGNTIQQELAIYSGKKMLQKDEIRGQNQNIRNFDEILNI